MRISTLLAICTFISSTLFAQQKGNILLGGTIAFYDYKTEVNELHSRQKSFYVTPTIGKFYANNRMAGINLRFSHLKYRDSLSSTGYGAGVFIRQYRPLGKSFFLFAEENVNGFISRYNLDQPDIPRSVKYKENTISMAFYPGIAYGLTKRLQLEVGLPNLFIIYYSHARYDNQYGVIPEKRKTNNFAVTTGFNDNVLGYLSFGMKWMLAKN